MMTERVCDIWGKGVWRVKIQKTLISSTLALA